MIELNINPTDYQNSKPYPHCVLDNILDKKFAKICQEEILSISEAEWDRYDNPFEQKFTLRDKNKLPQNCQKLFNYLTSEEFIDKLSNIVGYKLINDINKNFWRIHKYQDGDKIDIHTNAGRHPVNKLKKKIT